MDSVAGSFDMRGVVCGRLLYKYGVRVFWSVVEALGSREPCVLRVQVAEVGGCVVRAWSLFKAGKGGFVLVL